MKKIIFILVGLLLLAGLQAAERLSIPNVDTWRASALGSYVNKEVLFPVPVYVNSVSSGVTVSVRRMMSGTETCLPGSDEWKGYAERNRAGLFQLNGAGSNHRLGEVIENLVVRVNSASSVQYISGDWVANSREQLSQGPDWSALDQNGQHRLVVCAMNLEYYLVSDFGQGYGPDSKAEHERQRQKTSKALAAVHADIYGVVEVQKGSGALNELTKDLTDNTGRTINSLRPPPPKGGLLPNPLLSIVRKQYSSILLSSKQAEVPLTADIWSSLRRLAPARSLSSPLTTLDQDWKAETPLKPKKTMDKELIMLPARRRL